MQAKNWACQIVLPWLDNIDNKHKGTILTVHHLNKWITYLLVESYLKLLILHKFNDEGFSKVVHVANDDGWEEDVVERDSARDDVVRDGRLLKFLRWKVRLTYRLCRLMHSRQSNIDP